MGMDMLNRIDAVQWATYPQPEWNKPHSVVSSLSKVMTAKDAQSCSSAYESLLYSMGNNHAGTYYPVLLAAMPFQGEILLNGPRWPQRAVLCALDDLYASFHPEPGHEKISLRGESDQEVDVLFRRSVQSFRGTLERIESSANENSSLARELIGLLSDDAA